MSIKAEKIKTIVEFAKTKERGLIHTHAHGFQVDFKELLNQTLNIGDECASNDADLAKEIILKFNRSESVDIVIKALEFIKSNLKQKEYYEQLALCC